MKTKTEILKLLQDQFQIQEINLSKQQLETLTDILIEINKKHSLFKFSKHQINEIIDGVLNSLKKKQILFYANPIFDHQQMDAIKNGFIEKLSIEQIDKFIQPEFSATKIARILDMIKNNFPENIIQFCLNKTIVEIDIIKQLFSDGFNLFEIKQIIKTDLWKKVKNTEWPFDYEEYGSPHFYDYCTNLYHECKQFLLKQKIVKKLSKIFEPLTNKNNNINIDKFKIL